MTKQIEKISHIIHEIRKILGYATKEQVAKGWWKEMESVEHLIKEAKKHDIVSCGGFKYIKLKSGNIKITPDFSFIVRRKK